MRITRRSTVLLLAGGLATAGPAAAAVTASTLTTGRSLRLTSGTRVHWSPRTSGAGRSMLTMRDDGVLALTSARLLVWNNRVGNRCPRTRGSHGCTHVPARATAWFSTWGKVGTRVTIKR